VVPFQGLHLRLSKRQLQCLTATPNMLTKSGLFE
jgi:hypothetical protein